MGNASSARYMPNADAAEAFGGVDTWNDLKINLERIVGKYLDFKSFSDIIARKFEKIPRVLMECLYRAIAGDVTRKTDVESVLAACAAVESDNYVVNCRFLFKVYENEYSTNGNTLQRKIVEDILKLAYGERLRAHISAVHQLMEKMFGRSPMQELSLKEFETLNVDLSILRNWVRSVMRCFQFPSGRTSRLYALERKHSSQLEAKEVMSTHRLSRHACDELRRRYLHLCASAANQPRPSAGSSNSGDEEGGTVQVMDLSMRAELQLGAWLRAVSSVGASDRDPPNSVSYLEETLATVIFQAHVDAFKPKWRFVDFANFCAVFGGENRQLQATTVVDSYLKCALARFYGVDSRDRSVCGLPPLVPSNVSSGSSGGEYEGAGAGGYVTVGGGTGDLRSPSQESDLSSPFAQLSPPSTNSPLVTQDYEVGSGLGEQQLGQQQGVDAYVLQSLQYMVMTLASAHSNQLSPELLGALTRLSEETGAESYATDFSSFLVTHYQLLPGLRDLCLAACCRFGFLPPSPLREMEYVTELSLRYLQRSPQCSAHPYGRPGTEWCVIPRAWYEAWRLYVGHQHFRQQAERDGAGTPSPIDTSSGKNPTAPAGALTAVVPGGSAKGGRVSGRAGPPPTRPNGVDCNSMLRKPMPGGAHGMYGMYGAHGGGRVSGGGHSGRRGQLLPNLVVGRDVEVVCPAVFDALTAWYGGGPAIVRSVVAVTARTKSVDAHSPRANTAYGFKDPHSNSNNSSKITGGGNGAQSELELYPLSINIHTCDNAGNLNPTPLCEGLLFSKTSTVQEVSAYLCSTHTVEQGGIRLWNYAQPGREHWREQHILSPELTLQRANIQDGQVVLMEVSLLDGSWPRSLLHAYLDGEERAQQGGGPDGAGSGSAASAGAGEGSGEGTMGVNAEGGEDLPVFVDEYTGTASIRSTTPHTPVEFANRGDQPSLGVTLAGEGAGAAMVDAAASVAQSGVSVLTAAVGSVLGAPFPSGNTPTGPTDRKFSLPAPNQAASSFSAPTPLHKRNSGLVGMDNLGNTCYMNSSLQALLHTEPLVEYFLSKAYLRHLNLQSTHGFKGRLATSFGRLAQELWCTTAGSITPRWFKHDIAHLHEQFAGNEQHDAHELLAFLLDGLSEDLNLVCNKPYTEQPDSDGRPDSLLADIWWANHLKRDRSVIQALFSGQFKSVMTCTTRGCDYSSARFEPFTFLSLPIPEEAERIVGVTVVPLQQQCTVYCEVRVPRAGTLQDIVDRVLELNLNGLHDTSLGSVSAGISPRDSSRGSKRGKGRRGGQDKGKEQGPGGAAASPRPPVFFQAGELVRNKIRTFNSMERRVDTVRETECLVLFQVRRLPGDLPEPGREVAEVVEVGEQEEERGEATGKVGKGVTGAGDRSTVPIPPPVPVPVPPPVQTNTSAGSFDPEAFYRGQYNGSDRLVRVALCQRRVRMYDAAISNAGQQSSTSGAPTGTEFFQLEHFGLSALEVLPNKLRCSDLYRLVARRFAPFLKVPVRELIRHKQQQRHQQQQQLRHTASGSSLSSLATAAASGTGPAVPQDSVTPREELPVNLRLDSIRSADTDEVVGGGIPETGFTLRLISAGSTATCSHCSWLEHCDGCVLPDRDEVPLELRDGESVAVDWHFEVFETLLDTQALCAVAKHHSVTDSAARDGNFISTPLQRCFDKFTEQEKLDGVVCPRCKQSEGNVCKSFTLWRLPPVLVVQLKRFQFDHVSRRKLNNHIDFPFEGLDLYDYLAGSRQRALSTASQLDGEGGTESSTAATERDSKVTSHAVPDAKALAMAALYGDDAAPSATPSPAIPTADTGTQDVRDTLDTGRPRASTSSAAGGPDALCTKYDLYSVVHHAGALGGGHYAATARSLATRRTAEPTPSNNTTGGVPVDQTGSGKTSSGAILEGDAWYCFNDNIVTRVADPRTVCDSSAYVLFYMRQDMRQGDVLALLRAQLSIPDTVQAMETAAPSNTAQASPPEPPAEGPEGASGAGTSAATTAIPQIPAVGEAGKGASARATAAILDHAVPPPAADAGTGSGAPQKGQQLDGRGHPPELPPTIRVLSPGRAGRANGRSSADQAARGRTNKTESSTDTAVSGGCVPS